MKHQKEKQNFKLPSKKEDTNYIYHHQIHAIFLRLKNWPAFQRMLENINAREKKSHLSMFFLLNYYDNSRRQNIPKSN